MVEHLLAQERLDAPRAKCAVKWTLVSLGLAYMVGCLWMNANDLLSLWECVSNHVESIAVVSFWLSFMTYGLFSLFWIRRPYPYDGSAE